MDDIYKDNILDHYRNPRNYGRLDKPDFINEEENILCGDRIRMEVKLKVKSEKLKVKIIDDVKFSGEGCAISTASASILTERVKGISINAAKKLSTKDTLDIIGITLTPIRIKCALLPLEVLQKALGKDKDYPLAKSK